jgi:hypothetical protein
VTVAVKPAIGRPRTPKDVADRLALTRVASLAADILVWLRQPGRGMYSSERELKQWLTEDGVQFTTADIAPALGLLESTGKIQQAIVKPNAPRSGWLPGMAPEPAYTASEGILEDATALDVDPTTSEPVEEASKPPELPTEPTAEERINALAVAILKFEVPGRGYEGNRMLWESEDQLRQYLTADGVVYKESDLSAALTKLETAAVPGYDLMRMASLTCSRSFFSLGRRCRFWLHSLTSLGPCYNFIIEN